MYTVYGLFVIFPYEIYIFFPYLNLHKICPSAQKAGAAAGLSLAGGAGGSGGNQLTVGPPSTSFSFVIPILSFDLSSLSSVISSQSQLIGFPVIGSLHLIGGLYASWSSLKSSPSVPS